MAPDFMAFVSGRMIRPCSPNGLCADVQTIDKLAEGATPFIDRAKECLPVFVEMNIVHYELKGLKQKIKTFFLPAFEV